jgi:hypothetical protein
LGNNLKSIGKAYGLSTEPQPDTPQTPEQRREALLSKY